MCVCAHCGARRLHVFHSADFEVLLSTPDLINPPLRLTDSFVYVCTVLFHLSDNKLRRLFVFCGVGLVPENSLAKLESEELSLLQRGLRLFFFSFCIVLYCNYRSVSHDPLGGILFVA